MNKHNLVIKTVKNKNGIIEQVSRKKNRTIKIC